MASKQTVALFLVAMFALACVQTEALNCYDRNNCHLCQYCSRRSECGGSNLDYDHQQACGCQSACDGNCQAFCGYSGASGKRLLLGRGLNEVVDA
ncbi:hypothetical protein CVIRNUC_010674 [Coccomyxa viridis]|uniref:Uncharacterized protein n=1 Tax=Coccomyxa viridis TaxID=1274662 RepID=A0AAV1IJE0_9CHLO|nr:hypothetical protein CVIRNUC_010674 [Coccomyxa viridis]